jgi:hypothetical protein
VAIMWKRKVFAPGKPVGISRPAEDFVSRPIVEHHYTFSIPNTALIAAVVTLAITVPIGVFGNWQEIKRAVTWVQHLEAALNDLDHRTEGLGAQVAGLGNLPTCLTQTAPPKEGSVKPLALTPSPLSRPR